MDHVCRCKNCMGIVQIIIVHSRIMCVCTNCLCIYNITEEELMAKSKVKVEMEVDGYSCDRCGAEYTDECVGTFTIGKDTILRWDLCPDCRILLTEFVGKRLEKGKNRWSNWESVYKKAKEVDGEDDNTDTEEPDDTSEVVDEDAQF